MYKCAKDVIDGNSREEVTELSPVEDLFSTVVSNRCIHCSPS